MSLEKDIAPHHVPVVQGYAVEIQSSAPVAQVVSAAPATAPAAPPPPYAPHTHTPPAPLRNGTVHVEYLPMGCCAECWACCACCWVLPQPQPQSSAKFTISIDNQEISTLYQGQSMNYSVAPGQHTVRVLHAGASGFFRGIVGNKEAAMSTINVAPGETQTYHIGYRLPKCASKQKKYLVFEKV